MSWYIVYNPCSRGAVAWSAGRPGRWCGWPHRSAALLIAASRPSCHPARRPRADHLRARCAVSGWPAAPGRGAAGGRGAGLGSFRSTQTWVRSLWLHSLACSSRPGLPATLATLASVSRAGSWGYSSSSSSSRSACA